LRAELPRALTLTDKLTPRMVHVVEDLATDWRWLDQRIAAISTEIADLAHADDGAVRLMSVPGIGPIISSATVAGIGKGDVFGKGRDFAAWLGLVPKQTSTGGRPILGRISKRGNRYLRQLFVQAARVVLLRPASWERYGLNHWIDAAARRLHYNKLAIALANKHAGGKFETRTESDHASQPACAWPPCSAPSRHGLAASAQVARVACRPVSTAPCARRPQRHAGRGEGTATLTEPRNWTEDKCRRDPSLMFSRRGLREERSKAWRNGLHGAFETW
jgi:hypothetical protein